MNFNILNFQIKTHMQAKSNSAIAVGYQNECKGLTRSLAKIYTQYGVIGLWRGE